MFPEPASLGSPREEISLLADLLAFLEREGIRYVDLWPVFRQFPVVEIFPRFQKDSWDMHPSSFGHQLAAAQLYRALETAAALAPDGLEPTGTPGAVKGR